MLIAKSLPRDQLDDEQFKRLYALVECEYEKGKRFEEIAERFFMIYGKKAVSVDTLKTWYDSLESTRQSVQAPEWSATSMPKSNYVDTQSSIRCLYKQIIANAQCLALSPRVIDSRYVFCHDAERLSHFFVVDTFHDDVQ